MTRRAGLYVRISSDEEGRGLGVKRQEEDCREKITAREWDLLDLYVDNDVSATNRKKPRPEYQRMLGDLRAGRIDAVVVWDLDRLCREPREIEDIIDMAEQLKLELVSVGGLVDLATVQGRLMARMKGAIGKHEVEQASHRQKRQKRQSAESGRRHGALPFGWQPRPGNDATERTDDLHPEQAAAVVEAAERLLAGDSLRQITLDFERRGIPSPRGAGWSPTGLRQVLLRRSNIGEREHLGVVVARDCWPAILPADRWEAVVSLLKSPSRRTSPRDGGIRHLLSGLAICGKCGARLRVLSAHGTLPTGYFCQSCMGIRRKKVDVDDYVQGHIVARLSRPDALAVFTPDHSDELGALDEEFEALARRLASLSNNYALGLLEDDAWLEANATIKLRRGVLYEERARMMAGHAARDLLLSTDIETAWARMGLGRRRRVISTLMEVTIMPTAKRRVFDPNAIAIRWLHDAP